MPGTRKLTITACEVLKKGKSAGSGREWTMYEVFAVDEAGKPVEAKLRAFDPLPLNELVEYGIEMRQDERHGTSYTLSLPRELRPSKKDTGYKAQIQSLQVRCGRLEESNARLEARDRWLLGQINELRGALELEPLEDVAQSQPESGVTDDGAGNALATNKIPF